MADWWNSTPSSNSGGNVVFPGAPKPTPDSIELNPLVLKPSDENPSINEESPFPTSGTSLANEVFSSYGSNVTQPKPTTSMEDSSNSHGRNTPSPSSVDPNLLKPSNGYSNTSVTDGNSTHKPTSNYTNGSISPKPPSHDFNHLTPAATNNNSLFPGYGSNSYHDNHSATSNASTNLSGYHGGNTNHGHHGKHDHPSWSTFHKDHDHSKIDRNAFKRNMSIAKGFMDIGLFSANCNQLRALTVNANYESPLFYITLTLLLLSITLQLVTGVLLIVMERFNINKPHHQQKSLILNNITACFIFLTLVLNVIVTSFGVDVHMPPQQVIKGK